MTGPDFHELVGDEGTPEELAKLRRAHELLVAAGPPPELSPRLAEAPAAIGRTSWLPRRRRGAAFALAAGVVAAAFGVGFLIGDRGSSLIGDRDEVGNWQLLVRISGLKPLPKGSWYELYLTRKGKLAAYCGAFSVASSGRTTVQLSVPYKLKGYDGWVVTTNKREPQRPVLLTT